MNTELHQLTIEALKHKAGVAADTYDPADEETNWAKQADEQCRDVVAAGTVAALRASKIAQEELENYRGGDLPPREETTIIPDLCRAGWYDKHNPNSVSTRRVRIQAVDGVRYVVG